MRFFLIQNAGSELNNCLDTVNEENGDMKLIPMLEIRMADGGAKLPPQNELTPFSISVNNFTSDGSTKVAYVPLTVVTDEQTGERVAFSAQMRYLPTSVWNTAHSVRLAWVGQALIDQAGDKTDSTPVIGAYSEQDQESFIR